MTTFYNLYKYYDTFMFFWGSGVTMGEGARGGTCSPAEVSAPRMPYSEILKNRSPFEAAGYKSIEKVVRPLVPSPPPENWTLVTPLFWGIYITYLNNFATFEFFWGTNSQPL